MTSKNTSKLNAIGQTYIEAARLLKQRGITLDMTDKNIATLYGFLCEAIANGESAEQLSDRIVQLAEMQARLSALPVTSHNAVLDSEQQHCAVDFLQFVNDTHLLKQLAKSIANATDLPAHTVFLMGLGVFSSMACRRWCVEYRNHWALPIGLYVVAEQPSGTAKSRTLNTFQRPFYDAEKHVKDHARNALKRLKSKKDGELTEVELTEKACLERSLKAVLFVTNATPEALEQSLTNSNGYFSAVSSEQGLFNTLLGGCYGNDKASNNDLLLNAFGGDYMGSMRVSREGYTGIVAGGAVMFAQTGGIETILKASNGTGLAERFLFIAEPHNLGKRDFTQYATINHDLIAQYNALCRHFADPIIEDGAADFKDLGRLDISSEGWQTINQYRNSIEPHLADGGKYAHVAIRGAAAKVDMQIMKIAANLHLLSADFTHSTTIDFKHVQAAIGIVNAILEASLKLCADKGIIGVKAEYMAILSLFENGNYPRTEREIIRRKVDRTPFKDFTGNKSDLIRKTLNDMVNDSVLQVSYQPAKSGSGNPIMQYSLAQ